MPGMNSGLNINDPTVVGAFKHVLLHQGLIALALFIVLAAVWVAVREFWPAARVAATSAASPEAPARQLLRIGFGALWIIDGLLQAQPGMAAGLPSQVIKPAAESSPAWVQHLVNWAGTSWSYHPIQAAAAAVWIQVGIGLWLVLARRGPLSRLAGLASLGWGLVVWVFGESFGGILAPGLSWLTGAPGAATCYAIAGLLIALPERAWRTGRTGRLMTGFFGLFLVAMAILQAWPGRGFWQGSLNGQPGPLTQTVQSMAAMSQPGGTAGLVSGFASVVRAHGFAVNLVAVVAIGGTGLAFASGQRRLCRYALYTLAVLGLADWVLVQDLGIFGGLGTDPNSMLPMLMLAVAGFLALTPVPAATAPASEPEEPATAGPATAGPVAEPAVTATADPAADRAPRRGRPQLIRASRAFATARLATVISLGAIGLVLIGAVPLAAAQADRNASAILAQAIDGDSAPLNSAAPGFTLTDQHGQRVALSSLRGKVVLLTFLDPVCVTDCPLIAQEFRGAAQQLGGQGREVELVAVNVNPLYHDISYLQAFDREQRLTGLRNWLYFTGTPAELRPVWKAYGVASETLPAGSMLGHSDTAFVIGRDGRLVRELDFDPGPGTTATVSSFATELVQAAGRALGQP
jgi:cytochrome oxidase Cu insertion factor (SCO1/SenC/PrrC family)